MSFTGQNTYKNRCIAIVGVATICVAIGGIWMANSVRPSISIINPSISIYKESQCCYCPTTIPASEPDIPTQPNIPRDPVSAKPKSAPGSWIGLSDYRSAWINHGWEGIARFSVTVGTDGKVKNCQITASTGHDALDEATCKLVTRRARFHPARDKDGNAINGDYSHAVRWQIPK